MNVGALAGGHAEAMASQYHNLDSLRDLKTQAKNRPDEAIEKVAQQFESVFIQMMLSSMRAAVPKEGLFNSNQMETYNDMLDQQMSVTMAEQGGIGLAEVIVRQLKLQQPQVSSSGKAAIELDHNQQQWLKLKPSPLLTRSDR
jgi:peptidoglycan hydrolase FlgJ